MQNTKQLKTYDQVLRKAMKSSVFRNAYEEELTRLRMASEIRRLRTERKLSQQTMAELAEMPQSVIARVESGKHNVSVGTLNRIAHVLGKKVQLT